jgi:transcriptional regulator with XRE-family HTH domain
MEQAGWTQTDLAKRSGVSQKTISNMLGERGASSIENVDAVARAFGMDCWQLLLPGMVDAAGRSRDLGRLKRAWDVLEEDGREHVMRVAEREARYQEGA